MPTTLTTAASDAELVAAFVDQRQDAALAELVRRHQIPVYRRLTVELANPDDAETLCETVFVVASQRLAEWPRQTDLRQWLLDLAAEVSKSRPSEAADPSSPRLVDPAAFFKHSVHRALHSLEEEERAVLLAIDLEGQDAKQVALARNISVERVAEALDRARKRFAEALSRGNTPGPREHPDQFRVAPGDIVDKRYRVEALLGQGGMAAVFRAEHVAIKRKVALKTLHPTQQTQGMVRERFLREAEVLGKLAHPNFVGISDFGESSKGLSYLVMELLDGHPLSDEVSELGALPPLRALAVARQVCSGLAFAHGLGIIHRDIKPDNILVLNGTTGEGFAKILDLGIATTDGETGEVAALYGTPHYMAPEQISGERIDGRTDLYALGVTLFELLTGRLPFQGGSAEYILAQQLASPPPRLADVKPELPEREALQELLDACLAKAPEQRVRDAVTFGKRIEAVMARLGGEAPLAPELNRAAAMKQPLADTPADRGAGGRLVRVALWLGAAAIIAFLVWLALWR